MARTKTSKTSDAVESVPVSVPVVNSVVDESKSLKVPKAPKKVSEPKVASVTPAVQVTPVVPATPAVSVSVAPSAPVDDVVEPHVDGDSSLLEQSNEFLTKLSQVNALISSLKTEYRTLEKKWSRELKAAQKQSSKRKRKAGNRAPSGFVKPTRISDELASFLGKDNGSEMARTAVTRDINNYIRTNKLQDEKNGRKINPDAKLAALLKLEKSDELTYFNLQKYMSHHFSKNVKASVETASA